MAQWEWWMPWVGEDHSDIGCYNFHVVSKKNTIKNLKRGFPWVIWSRWLPWVFQPIWKVEKKKNWESNIPHCFLPPSWLGVVRWRQTTYESPAQPPPQLLCETVKEWYRKRKWGNEEITTQLPVSNPDNSTNFSVMHRVSLTTNVTLL